MREDEGVPKLMGFTRVVLSIDGAQVHERSEGP
jgi:hypothetical protein